MTERVRDRPPLSVVPGGKTPEAGCRGGEPPLDPASGWDEPGGVRREVLSLMAAYEEHNKRVLRYLRRFGVYNPADLEEQAMEVWTRVSKHWKEFRGEAQITTWLFGFCWRVAGEFHKSANARRMVPTAPEELPVKVNVSVEDALAAAVDVTEALEKLPPQERAALVLFYVEERTASDVAERLDLTTRAVYSCVERAVERVKKILRGEE